MTTHDELEDRFAGAMLGTMVGDQLGAPFEGQPIDVVAHRLAPNVDAAAEWIRLSRYTDDTQMMIGVAESLVERRGFDGEHMAGRFGENYEPFRGYGSGAHQLLSALRDGYAWDRAATLVFQDGSFGTGAAMRVAPIGVLYHDRSPELRRVAEASASITHAHPLDTEGATLQATAVALAIQGECEDQDFLTRLCGFARIELDEFARRLAAVRELLGSQPARSEVVARLGNDIRAHASVPAAVYAFLYHPDSFEEAVIYAVSLGGDTDTIGAMTGAIAGACHGMDSIEEAWLEVLENDGNGRDYLRELAHRLCLLFLKKRD